MMSQDLILRLRDFMDSEARSCSIDFGCVTPLYVYRMLGGTVPMEDIKEGLIALKNDCR